jgi:ERCC4-type nuclease
MNTTATTATVLTVDSRETRSGMLTMLRTMGVPTAMEEMPAGDYRIGPYLIERKTSTDLAASILDGRLFEQAESICTSADRPMLLIEGDITRIASQIQTEALMGAISALSVFWSLQVIQLPDIDSSARFLARLHKHLTHGLGMRYRRECRSPVYRPMVPPRSI